MTQHKRICNKCSTIRERHKSKEEGTNEESINQIPHVTRETIWKSDKKHKETSHTRE